jgi:superfamily II DNA or RNA helicase
MSRDHGSLRAHQQQALDIADDYVLKRRTAKCVVASVTPGGGKTLMASLYAHHLLSEGEVDFVLVVVPRDTLRTQVANGFHDEARGLDGFLLSDPNKSLRQSTTSGRCPVGYVTTYQEIAANSKRWQKRMVRGRWLLVLDEPHHLATVADAVAGGDDPAWSVAVRPLYDLAKLVLLMSGTMRRHDGQPIPFVQYDDAGLPIADVVYTRRQALDERAILPVDFVFQDGHVAWDRRGRTHAMDLTEASAKQLPDAVRTALTEDGFQGEFLRGAIDDWSAYRATVYRSRMIVICYRQESARAVASMMRGRGLDVALCISDDAKARERLRKFRERNDGDVLVTVGMAYEGLDVPDCTHLVCLTNVTSEPWLEQAFARVTRFNPNCGRPWDDQRAAIYLLDHPKNRAIAVKMNSEQVEPIRPRGAGGDGPAHPHGASSYVSRLGEKGRATYGVDGRVYTAEENDAIDRVKRTVPAFADAAPSKLLDAAVQLGFLAEKAG